MIIFILFSSYRGELDIIEGHATSAGDPSRGSFNVQFPNSCKYTFVNFELKIFLEFHII